MPVFKFAYLTQFFYIWDKGLSFWGALFGFLIMLAIICFKRGENILKWLDRLITPIGLGLIIANFGQLLDGQGYGIPTDMPWGMAYESINVKYTVPIHPVQIYSMIYVSGILFVLRKFKKHEFFTQEGNKTLVAVSLYSFIRIFMEMLRGDDTLELFGIRIASVICTIIFVISGYILLKRAREA